MSARKKPDIKAIKPSASEQAIKAAHEKGRLFVHMLEAPLSTMMDTPEPGRSLENFFDVLAGRDRSHYFNEYHDVVGTPDGHPALATSLLTKGRPMPLFLCNSQIGILIDGMNEKHAKPLFVNHGDAWSEVNGNHLDVDTPRADRDNAGLGKKLLAMQAVGDLEKITAEDPQKNIVRISLRDVSPERREKANRALTILADTLKAEPWDKIYPAKAHASDMPYRGMNEVLLSTRLPAVKAIMVSEKPNPDDKLDAKGASDAYKHAVAEAVTLRDFLYERYPEQFPAGSLPVVSYHPDRVRGQLHVLTPEQIQAPKLSRGAAYRE